MRQLADSEPIVHAHAITVNSIDELNAGGMELEGHVPRPCRP